MRIYLCLYLYLYLHLLYSGSEKTKRETCCLDECFDLTWPLVECVDLESETRSYRIGLVFFYILRNG